MKKITLISYVSILLICFSCSSDDDSTNDTFAGTETDLEDFFSEEVVDALIALDFTINEGGSPPNLQGTYFASPMILTDTNVPSDVIGSKFVDLQFTFFGQENSENTIDFEGETLSGSTVIERLSGIDSSFISGEGNDFSVFSIITGEIVNTGAVADVAYAISGTISNDGILDFEIAILILDDRGDPTNSIFLQNGQGRKFIDQDGMSELSSSVDLNGLSLKNKAFLQ